MRKFRASFLMALVFLLVFTATAAALESRSGVAVRVEADEVINDDLVLAGEAVTIEGMVNGDVAATGGRVVVTGTINGNLYTSAETLEIQGRVTGTVISLGKRILIAGQIDRSLVAAGGAVVLDGEARVGHTLAAVGDRLQLDGSVGRAMMLGGDDVRISGEVGREIRVAADRLRVTESATVRGQVDYWSDDAEIRGDVGGATGHGSSRNRQLDRRPWYRSPWSIAIKFGGFLVFGLVALSLLPGLRRTFPERMVSGSWKVPLAGFLILIAVPVAAIILMATLVGLPLGALSLLSFPVLVYLSQVLLAYALAHLLADRIEPLRGQNWAVLFVTGAVLTTILTELPIVGPLFTLAALFYGLGGLWFALIQREEAA